MYLSDLKFMRFDGSSSFGFLRCSGFLGAVGFKAGLASMELERRVSLVQRKSANAELLIRRETYLDLHECVHEGISSRRHGRQICGADQLFSFYAETTMNFEDSRAE